MGRVLFLASSLPVFCFCIRHNIYDQSGEVAQAMHRLLYVDSGVVVEYAPLISSRDRKESISRKIYLTQTAPIDGSEMINYYKCVTE